MSQHAHILTLREKYFVLWRPGNTVPAPTLFIGTFSETDGFILHREHEFRPSTAYSDVWLISIQDCGLSDSTVYHYWYKVASTNPYHPGKITYCTDPFARSVDERIQGYQMPEGVPTESASYYSPAGVVLFKDGRLHESDPDGRLPSWDEAYTSDAMDHLPANNKLVIYELPPRWSSSKSGQPDIVNGNFRQVEKMIAFENGDTYLDQLLSGVVEMHGEKYIPYLGVNALELTPPANSEQTKNWGYGTAHYLAPDYTLSVRNGNDQNDLVKPTTDFVNLVKACHKKGLRFFYDAVMAFTTSNPYRDINYFDFLIHWGTDDPEQGARDGFGGDLLKYRFLVNGYHPQTGQIEALYPARTYMKIHLKEWIKQKGVSGLRLDSVVNIDNFDFLEEIKNETRTFFKEETGGTDDKYLVVAEELAVPRSLLDQQRVDGQWNEVFKEILRHVILGQGWRSDNFEWSVKKLIDCRLLDRGFTRGDQAVNYVTSHDVGGMHNERIYSYLVNNGIFYTEKRIKLAFSCLLTAVGIPLILAGDEFGDQQDEYGDDRKQRDPVGYDRLKNDEWRQRILQHVRRLIHLRTTSEALFADYTAFIHVDFNYGRRIVVWKRGQGEQIVVTVANFSDARCDNYIVPNLPYREPKSMNKQWVEITQARVVEQIDWENIEAWEAKVYALQDVGEPVFV